MNSAQLEHLTLDWAPLEGSRTIRGGMCLGQPPGCAHQPSTLLFSSCPWGHWLVPFCCSTAQGDLVVVCEVFNKHLKDGDDLFSRVTSGSAPFLNLILIFRKQKLCQSEIGTKEDVFAEPLAKPPDSGGRFLGWACRHWWTLGLSGFGSRVV